MEFFCNLYYSSLSGPKKKNPNIRKPGASASITSMFAASAAKRKTKPKTVSKFLSV